MNSKQRIPVTMYHGIGDPLPGWLWGHLITPPSLFEKQITLLREKGYSFLDLDEYRDVKAAGKAGVERQVVLTFDDGYLDNWVYAYPLLKKLGARGTIYVNPDFIDPGETPRPNLEDYWEGRCGRADLKSHGFLNRAELRALHASGVMIIASHSNTHTWYPCGPEIVDFHRPGLDTPWLAWNARPERKPFYLTEDQSGFVPWGTPIFTHGRALGIRRCHPDPGLTAAATAFVQAHGGEGFFDRPDWRARLENALPKDGQDPGWETPAEQEARFRDEIIGSKTTLEKLLNGPVEHFCWPGGAYCEESWSIAETAGYRTLCITRRDPERWREDRPEYVLRIGSGDLVFTPRGRFRTHDPRILYLICEQERGAADPRWEMRLRKFLTMARSGFRPDQT